MSPGPPGALSRPYSALRRLISDRMLRNNAIYLSGTLAAGAFGYVFHFVAGRLLGPAEYAVIASAVAALYFLTLPALVVQTVSARFTSVAIGRGRSGNVPGLLLQVTVMGLLVGALVAITLLVLRGQLSSYLQISDRRVVPALALASLVALVLAATRGALQGLQRFVALSINIAVDMVARVGSLVALVAFGLGALGGVIAIVIGPAIAYGQSLFLFRGMGESHPADRTSLGQVGRYAVLAAVGAIGTVYLYNVDVLLSKHYLAAGAAGIYAAASVLGRVAYFLGLTVTQVMFPEVATLHAKNEPHYHVVDRSLGLLALITIGLTVIYALVPGLVVLPFGAAFGSAKAYLWPFALALGLLSLSNLLINYFLSIGRSRFVIPLLGACLLESALIINFHSNAGQVLSMVLITMTLLSIVLVGMYAFERLRLGGIESAQ
jgi:O-antigen/teichoic acid export membrane protein